MVSSATMAAGATLLFVGIVSLVCCMPRAKAPSRTLVLPKNLNQNQQEPDEEQSLQSRYAAAVGGEDYYSCTCRKQICTCQMLDAKDATFPSLDDVEREKNRLEVEDICFRAEEAMEREARDKDRLDRREVGGGSGGNGHSPEKTEQEEEQRQARRRRRRDGVAPHRCARLARSLARSLGRQRAAPHAIQPRGTRAAALVLLMSVGRQPIKRSLTYYTNEQD